MDEVGVIFREYRPSSTGRTDLTHDSYDTPTAESAGSTVTDTSAEASV